MAEGKLPDAIEVIPDFCSVTLHSDSLAASQATLVAQVETLLADVTLTALSDVRIWELPCC